MRALLMAMFIAGTVAAQSPQPPAATPPGAAVALPDENLDEIQVSALGPARNRDFIILWLRQLPGRFVNEGTLLQQGNTIAVSGRSECVGIGAGPGVRCVIMLAAPGIDTHLNPGAYMLGLDLERPMAQYMSIDDTGVAAVAAGELRGDTFRFQTPCRAGSARTCTSTTRISTRPGSDTIRLRVDIRVDGRLTTQYDITQTRVK